MSLPPITTVTGKELTTIFVSYLLGCFTAGYYWVRWRTGQDIRQEGSGNVGARNAGRILGATAFAATLLLDHFSPAAVVFSGTAGAVDPELNPGDVVFGTAVGHDDVVDVHDDSFEPEAGGRRAARR